MAYVRPVIEIDGPTCGDEDRLLAEEMGWGWSSVKKVAGKGVKVATKAAIAPVTMPSKVTAKVVAKAAPKILPKPLAKVATKSTAFAARATETAARAPVTIAQKASGPALAIANQIKKYGLKVALAPMLAVFWQAVNKRQRAGEPNRAKAAQWVANQVKAKLGPLGTVFVFLLKQAGTSVSGQSYVGADPVTWGTTITLATTALAAIMKYVNFAEGIIKTGKKAKEMVDPMIAIMARKKAEEEAAKKRAEEEARRRAEEEARRRAEEEARRRAEEEAARRRAEEEEEEEDEPTAEEAVDEEIESDEPTAEEAVEGCF